MAWVQFTAALIIALLLGSIAEWIIHRHFMHTTKFLRVAFERHAIKHHAERRAPGKYRASESEMRDYHLFETSFMPVVWLLHFPFYLLAWRVFGPWAGAGCIVGAGLYVLAYEVLHWYMHCEQNFPFRHHAWFRFLSEHHRRHHHRATINYNVVCPLGDLIFGTFSLLPVDPEPAPPHHDP